MNTEQRKKSLLITEVAMTLVLILFIGLCLGGRVRGDVSLKEITPVILEQVSDASHMKEEGAMKLRSLYGLTENEYQEVVLYTPVSNMDAQEMLLIRCKSEDQAAQVEVAMKERNKYMVSIFESYGVEQMGIINKAVIDVQGTYCLYVCDENSAAVKDAFETAVKG